jgi:hypothetical protein
MSNIYDCVAVGSYIVHDQPDTIISEYAMLVNGILTIQHVIQFNYCI